MTEKLDRLTDRPKVALDNQKLRLSPDGLSHLLAWVRLSGESVHQSDLRNPQIMSFPAGPSHVHFIESGQASLKLNDGTTLTLASGDVVLLPHGAGHELIQDGEGPATRIIGGLFRYERQPLPPVIRALPPLIHVKSPAGGVIPEWLHAMAFFLMAEANQPAPGSALMISRMIDLLVIRVLRSWADLRPAQARWLGGLGDERLGRALAAMHEGPEYKWSVESLAGLAGMSRSVFADRFTVAFGEPPLRYLMRWRFTIASELLADSRLSIGEIARAVGYESEPGFSRAFRTFDGHSPSERRSRTAKLRENSH